MEAELFVSDLLVHAVAWFEGRLGYNVHSRNFFDALARLTPVHRTEMIGRGAPSIAEDRAEIQGKRGPLPVASVALTYGELMGVLDGADAPRVGYTVWESTRLPRNWLAPLAGLDEIWVPSAWGRKVMIENGLPETRIAVVPEGYDAALFRPGNAPSPVLAGKAGFTFLSVGKYEKRKGIRDAILAFDRCFGADDDVAFLVMCHNPHDPGFDMGRELRSMDLRRPGRIFYLPPVASHGLLASVYASADAFVLPTRAEGWGLPILEAMGSGLPVIVPDHGGQSAYLGPEAYRINHRLARIEDPIFEDDDGDWGFWAEPDPEHLMALMREVYEDRDAARRRALAGARRVAKEFTWDRAAETALARLRSLLPR